jgi:metal-dependent amidase/aminoacylase/carboxypeptidase family protein
MESLLSKPAVEFALKQEHHRMMKEAGCDIDGLIALRRDIHRHAEPGFKEFETQRKVKEKLLSFGIEDDNIRASAGTGLVVDIFGTMEADQVEPKVIALRADMDALPIEENNPGLPHASVTKFAHMCGHDGHTCTLLSAA